MNTTVCEKCGVTLEEAMWPFCPHPLMEGPPMLERDEIPGGIVLENYGPHPVRFDSHSERRRYMVEHGLEEKGNCAPFPGTDKDPMGIPDPRGYVDRQTLENGRILIERQQKGKAPVESPDPSVVSGTMLNTEQLFLDATKEA